MTLVDVIYTLCSSLPMWCRYYFWIGFAELARRCGWVPLNGRLQGLPFGICIKRNDGSEESFPANRFTEGHATRFVRRNTRIPVPEILDVVRYNGYEFFIMTILPGEGLHGRIMQSQISDGDSAYLVAQLREYLSQLRRLTPPSERVTGFGGGQLYDGRLSFEMAPMGPWDSTRSFKLWLEKWNRPLHEPRPERPSDLLDKHLETPHNIVFTHGDLHPCNVLVDENLRITGILDWEACGWLPEYWEYSKSSFPALWRGEPIWDRIMSAIFPYYEAEKKAEHFLRDNCPK